MSDKVLVSITVNGQMTTPREVPVDLPLIDYLHEELSLTGTKFCCGIGVCRACTVAVRNLPGAPAVPTLSCSTPASAVNGYEITTVEGFGQPQQLSKLQNAFLDHFAFQCGYCAPGFLVAAEILLERLRNSPVPSEQIDAEIARACGAHICRCTGYIRYYEAIKAVIMDTPGLVL